MFSESSWYQDDIKYIADLIIEWDKIKDTSILVTGATGLIGTVLIDALMYKNKNHGLNVKVFALARNQDRLEDTFKGYIRDDLFQVVEGDIVKEIAINEKIDFIIHLASNTHPALYASEPIQTIDSIVLGTKNILNFATTHQTVRVINTSSVEVYGENRGDVERFSEDYCGYINCNTLRAGYPEGKRLAEALCAAYVAEKNIDIVSARLGRFYGSTNLKADTKSTTQFINNAVNDEDILLKSKGMQKFSYAYVADVVTAFLLLLTKGESGEAYNIADDEVKTFREVAGILANINDREVRFEIPTDSEQKGVSVVQTALINSSKLKALGWRAKYDLRSGMERTVHILRDKYGNSEN